MCGMVLPLTEQWLRPLTGQGAPEPAPWWRSQSSRVAVQQPIGLQGAWLLGCSVAERAEGASMAERGEQCDQQRHIVTHKVR